MVVVIQYASCANSLTFMLREHKTLRCTNSIGRSPIGSTSHPRVGTTFTLVMSIKIKNLHRTNACCVVSMCCRVRCHSTSQSMCDPHEVCILTITPACYEHDICSNMA
jgi:hypothetical protein